MKERKQREKKKEMKLCGGDKVNRNAESRDTRESPQYPKITVISQNRDVLSEDIYAWFSNYTIKCDPDNEDRRSFGERSEVEMLGMSPISE